MARSALLPSVTCRVLVLALVVASCGGSSTSPTSIQSPPVASPSARPLATAMENLPLVARLQAQIAPASALFHVQANVDPHTGRLRSGDAGWEYYFVAYDAAGSPDTKHYWTVRGDGRVEHRVGPRAYDQVIDLMPVTVVDSDTVVRLGLERGAQAYIDRYPAATVTATLRISITEPVWKVQYYLHPISGGPECAVTTYFHATTGAFVDSDLRCLDTFPRS
jgi:hypothetical protein